MGKEKDDHQLHPQVPAFEKRLRAAVKKEGVKNDSMVDLAAKFANIEHSRREEILGDLRGSHPHAQEKEIAALMRKKVVDVLGDPLFERQIIDTLIANEKLGVHKTGALTEYVFWEHVEALQGEYQRRGEWHATNHSEGTMEKEPFTLLALDIDNFKLINDTYGHDAGDEAILQLVKIIKESLYVDDIIGSVGGDELDILMKTGTEHAAKKAEDIRKKVAEHLFIVHDNNEQECRIHITVSIGVTPHDQDTKAMKRRADGALYSAKGKNRSRGNAQLRAMRERNAVWIWGVTGNRPYAKTSDHESEPPPTRK